jgi:hypothetical protein
MANFISKSFTCKCKGLPKLQRLTYKGKTFPKNTTLYIICKIVLM